MPTCHPTRGAAMADDEAVCGPQTRDDRPTNDELLVANEVVDVVEVAAAGLAEEGAVPPQQNKPAQTQKQRKRRARNDENVDVGNREGGKEEHKGKRRRGRSTSAQTAVPDTLPDAVAVRRSRRQRR